MMFCAVVFGAFDSLGVMTSLVGAWTDGVVVRSAAVPDVPQLPAGAKNAGVPCKSAAVPDAF